MPVLAMLDTMVVTVLRAMAPPRRSTRLTLLEVEGVQRMVMASPGLQTWPHVGWVMALSSDATDVTATAMRDKMVEKRIV